MKNLCAFVSSTLGYVIWYRRSGRMVPSHRNTGTIGAIFPVMHIFVIIRKGYDMSL